LREHPFCVCRNHQSKIPAHRKSKDGICAASPQSVGGLGPSGPKGKREEKRVAEAINETQMFIEEVMDADI
jgi:hypothetical protein